MARTGHICERMIDVRGADGRYFGGIKFPVNGNSFSIHFMPEFKWWDEDHKVPEARRLDFRIEPVAWKERMANSLIWCERDAIKVNAHELDVLEQGDYIQHAAVDPFEFERQDWMVDQHG